MSFLMIIPTNVNAEEIIPVNISVKYGQTEARRILDMINELRTSPTDAWAWDKTDTKQVAYPGLKELVYDYDLERLAMKRAAEIALSYEHTRPNGQNPFTIYTEENITRLDTGENIAVASPNVYSKAEAVNDGWREDNEPYAGQGHRRNMLGYKFTCVGVGHVTYNGYDYWVEEFASRPSINTTETPANDNEQTVTVSVTKSWITNYKTYFDQDSYVLRLGETVTPNITPIISLINQFGSVGTVLDTPTVSINDPSIATYSDGKIIGLKEGTTTLTTSLYGLPSTTSATIIVHDCDNHWDGGVITKVPTCTKEGEKKFTCAICNNTKIEKIGIDATNHLHSEIRNQKEASCKEEGYSGDKYCPDCGTKLSSGNTIAKTEMEQEKLIQKMNSMDASKRFVPTQEFKDLEANIAKSESAYAKLEEKQKALEAAGKATVPSADYSEVKAHYDDAQARLEKLIAKQREWLDLGFKPGDGGAMTGLTEQIKEVETEMKYLKGEMKDLEDNGKAMIPTDQYRENTNQLSIMRNKLKEYKDLRSSMLLDGSNLQESEQYQRDGVALSDLTNRLREYNAERRSMENSGTDILLYYRSYF